MESASGDATYGPVEGSVDGGGDRGAAGSAINIKVGMVGDASVGKTSLMVKYVEDRFDPEYIQTLGVSFMQKSILLGRNEIIFGLWDLGGETEFNFQLPLVCSEALVMLYTFDLTRQATLLGVREWYRRVRALNRTALPFLIGTKYDAFCQLPIARQEKTTKQARVYAEAMRAPLIFTSASGSVNIIKLFKVILQKIFSVDFKIEKVHEIGQPIIEF